MMWRKDLIPIAKKVGTKLALVGSFKPTILATEYLYQFLGKDTGKIPEVSLELEKKTIDTLIDLRKKGLLSSAKDLSLGGLLVATAKIVISGTLGLKLDFTAVKSKTNRLDELLFGETGSSFLVGYMPENEMIIQKEFQNSGLEFFQLGEFTNSPELQVTGSGFQLAATKSDLVTAFEKGLKVYFE